MATHGISGSTPPMAHPPVSTQHVQQQQQQQQDNDGDNDGSRAGEVEAQELAPPGSAVGSIINTTA